MKWIYSVRSENVETYGCINNKKTISQYVRGSDLKIRIAYCYVCPKLKNFEEVIKVITNKLEKLRATDWNIQMDIYKNDLSFNILRPSYLLHIHGENKEGKPIDFVFSRRDGARFQCYKSRTIGEDLYMKQLIDTLIQLTQ